MDSALSTEDRAVMQQVLQTHQEGGVQFHKLQTRQVGARKFVSVHVLVPGAWTVHRGHELAGHIASDLRQALLEASVITHIEPLDAPSPTDSAPASVPPTTESRPVAPAGPHSPAPTAPPLPRRLRLTPSPDGHCAFIAITWSIYG